MKDIVDQLRDWRNELPPVWYGIPRIDAAISEIERLRSRPVTAGADEPVAWAALSSDADKLRIWWRDKAAADAWAGQHNRPVVPLYAKPFAAADFLPLATPTASTVFIDFLMEWTGPEVINTARLMAAEWQKRYGSAVTPQVLCAWETMETAPKDGTRVDLYVYWPSSRERSTIRDCLWTGSHWEHGHLEIAATPTHWCRINSLIAPALPRANGGAES